jgi:hypothetical protein
MTAENLLEKPGNIGKDSSLFYRRLGMGRHKTYLPGWIARGDPFTGK